MRPLRTSYHRASRRLHTSPFLMHTYPFLVHTYLPIPSSQGSVTGDNISWLQCKCPQFRCAPAREQEPWLNSSVSNYCEHQHAPEEIRRTALEKQWKQERNSRSWFPQDTLRSRLHAPSTRLEESMPSLSSSSLLLPHAQ